LDARRQRSTCSAATSTGSSAKNVVDALAPAFSSPRVFYTSMGTGLLSDQRRRRHVAAGKVVVRSSVRSTCSSCLDYRER
jgi:hypothetical protein